MRFCASLAIVILLTACASFAAAEGEGPPTPVGLTPFQQLMPIFQTAAETYNVPLNLLVTLGYFGSAFENRGDSPTIEGGYGVMALRDNDNDYGIGNKSLQLASQLTGVPVATLKTDPVANINGAAAVLDYYATMWQVDRSAGIDAWLDVVITYAALDKAGDETPIYSRFFAMEIFQKIRDGMDTVNSGGERVALMPQSIGSVNLAALEPPGARVSAGYSGAIWYPAASCNYSAYYTSKNTVVVHTIEGTASGCLGWFRNCNANVSAHYVVSEAGTVWQCVDENYRAWHVGCANNYCIGLEHEGYASSPSHPTALYNGSAACVRDICNRWGISKTHRTCPPGILGHNDINNCVCGGTHWDPGGGWNWSYYINQVGGGTPPPPSYAATYHAQSYPSSMTAGSTATAWVEYNNTGTATWGHAATRLGTSSPQDRSSPFYNSGNWINAGRPTEVDQSAVTNGQVGRFTFILKAPTTPGTYTEHYKLVQEGVTWFGSEVTWTITVTASKGNVTGTVRDSYDNGPISGATVAISGGPTTTTNSSGVYTLNSLDPATYTLNVSASNYSPTSGTATVTAGSTTTKDFTMTSTDHSAPTAPGTLSATAISPSQIDLSWGASTDSGGSGLDRYIVYRGGVEVGRTTSLTYTDNGLSALTPYSYFVKAIDNAGNVSDASNTASATTLPGTVPIFQDGFVNTDYWQALKESAMPDFYPPLLVGNNSHSQFAGDNSLQTRTSDIGAQGCLIGHTFGPTFAAATYDTWFFDGTGVAYVGDFTDTTEGWSAYPSSYATLAVAGGGYSGNCLQATDGGWTCGFYKEFTSGFAAGEYFSLSMRLKFPAAPAGKVYNPVPVMFARFFDGAGAQIGSDVTAGITTDGAWHLCSATGTIPGGTAKIWIGAWGSRGASETFNYQADSVSFWSSTNLINSNVNISNNSRQGLQVRCHDSGGTVRAIYYLGTYSAAPGAFAKYSAGYYKIGDTEWTWSGAQCADRKPGWRKLTIDVQPYTGAGDEVKFRIDGVQVATAGRTMDTQTYGIDMVAYGYHYRVNVPGRFDDCAMYASAPVQPTMGTAAALSPVSIRWNLTDNANNEIGFKILNAAQAVVASSGFSNGTGGAISCDEAGLAPNTAYTRTAKAFNGSLDSLASAAASRWTLSVAPTPATVTCDHVEGTSGYSFNAVGGFGAGTVEYYRYAWDTSPTYSWTGSESQWNSGALILSAGSSGSYYLHVQGYNGENVANGALDLGPYAFDDLPPTNPTSAVETHGAANDTWQSTVAAPSFTWTGASDASGIAGYNVYLGTEETGTSGTFVTTAEYTSSALAAGTYYLRLQAKDNAGVYADEWATLFTFKYDDSAPAVPTVAADGKYSGSATKLHGTWNSSDAESGIEEYQYALGTSIGGTDIVGWTSAGTAIEAVITIPDPGMQPGVDYYISAKAKNTAGLWSDVGSSGDVELAPDRGTIGAAKLLDHEEIVGLNSKVVTAVLGGGFYIEEPNRSSGILVMGDGPGRGAVVTIGGKMGVNGVGERAILEPIVTVEADPLLSRVPGPLSLVISQLGGSPFGFYTQGVSGMKGLNNVGLFVKVFGAVVDEQETHFTLTDGINTIKVITATMNGLGLDPGQHVMVTGISSLELDGTTLLPVVRLIEPTGVTELD